jgi:hypothetical protein
MDTRRTYDRCGRKWISQKFGYTVLYQIIESSVVSKTSEGKVTATATATVSVFSVLETEGAAFDRRECASGGGYRREWLIAEA